MPSIVNDILKRFGYEASESNVNTNEGQELNDQKTEDSHSDDRGDITLAAKPKVKEPSMEVSTYAGWMDPSGAFYPLDGTAYTHSAAARIHHNSNYADLLRDGWVRVDEGGIEVSNIDNITDAQWVEVENILVARGEIIVNAGRIVIPVESSDLAEQGVNLQEYVKSWKGLASTVGSKKLSMISEWLTKKANDPIQKTVDVNGIKISIEWPKGSTRTWKGSDYKRVMKADYGYIKNTEGEDGEEWDVYVGPNPSSQKVFKIAQMKKDGTYDEDKFMVGYDSKEDAVASFQDHMPKEQTGEVTEMSWGAFAKMVKKEQSKESSLKVEALVIQQTIDGVEHSLSVQPVYGQESENIESYKLFDQDGTFLLEVPNPSGTMLSAVEIHDLVYKALQKSASLNVAASVCANCKKEFQETVIVDPSPIDSRREPGISTTHYCPECKAAFEKELKELRDQSKRPDKQASRENTVAKVHASIRREAQPKIQLVDIKPRTDTAVNPGESAFEAEFTVPRSSTRHHDLRQMNTFLRNLVDDKAVDIAAIVQERLGLSGVAVDQDQTEFYPDVNEDVVRFEVKLTGTDAVQGAGYAEPVEAEGAGQSYSYRPWAGIKDKTLVKGRYDSRSNKFEIKVGTLDWQTAGMVEEARALVSRVGSYSDASAFVDKLVDSVDSFHETLLEKTADLSYNWTDEQISMMVSFLMSSGWPKEGALYEVRQLMTIGIDAWMDGKRRDMIMDMKEALEKMESRTTATLEKSAGKTCCVCGAYIDGEWKQWPNRDTGFSICPACVTWVKGRGMSDEEIKNLYGVAGVNYPSNATEVVASEPAPTIYQENGSVGDNKPGSLKTPTMPEVEAAAKHIDELHDYIGNGKFYCKGQSTAFDSDQAVYKDASGHPAFKCPFDAAPLPARDVLDALYKKEGAEEEEDELGEDIIEPINPGDEDIVIQDVGRLGAGTAAFQNGRQIARLQDDDWDAFYGQIAAWMKSHSFYPEVWYVSDHGNADFDTGWLDYTKTNKVF